MEGNPIGTKGVDIEDYAKKGPQYYSGEIPLLLKEYLKFKNYSSLLDCGCGDGATLYALKTQSFLENKKVYALDLSKSRIEIIKQIDSRIKAFIDNAETMLNIKDDSIDFFISLQVIEHVMDQTRMLNCIDRVVKKGGIVYLSTVFKKWYGWYFYRNNGRWVLDPTHLREYGKDSELLELIDKEKFEILENKKSLLFFPIIDFFVKRLHIKNRNLYNNKFLRLIRKIKRPIIGYYNWEIVLRKR